MPTRNIDLSDHFDSFLSAAVEDGRYRDVSEAVSAGLRLLEQREHEDAAKLANLQAIAKDAFDALDRGEGITLNSVDDVDDLVNEAVTEARAEHQAAHV